MTQSKKPKPKKKNIAAMFGEANEQSKQASDSGSPIFRPKSTSTAGVVKSFGRSVEDIIKERDELEAKLEKAGGTIEVNPTIIDPSPFADRLEDDNAETYEEFKQSIDKDGQQVPVQLRPHPTEPGRYQTIYGHRRCRALRELGKPVKALVVEMDDTALLLAQGIENSRRQDLSWIERALFAHQLESQGIKPADCQKALGVDKVAMSNYRKVIKVVTPAVVSLIGRAPTIGRPRWVELADLKPDSADLVKRLSADNLKSKSSDDRFNAVLAALKQQKQKSQPTQEKPEIWQLGSIAKVKASASKLEFSIAEESSEAFLAFMKDELPELLKRFQSRDTGK